MFRKIAKSSKHPVLIRTSGSAKLKKKASQVRGEKKLYKL